MIKSERGEHMPGFEEIVGHEQIVTHLKSAMKLGKVSHAYILSGEKGCGKKLLADVFAETLQCEKGGTEPCGSCHSCVQAQSGNHPDIIHLMHEKPNSISVDDVRTQIVNDVLIKPYSGKYKIYIVPDAGENDSGCTECTSEDNRGAACICSDSAACKQCISTSADHLIKMRYAFFETGRRR